jgi:putative component of membrane protein insertase Oxa1/YidC/SpoIIIJ protein YidD
MLRYAGAALIRVYQRYLSPRKGYRCAYGVLHGAGTCSYIGLGIMEQQGFWAFWRKMPLQFDACRAAASTLENESDEQKKARRKRLKDESRKRDCSRFDNCGGVDDCELPCDLADLAFCEAAAGLEILSCN